MKSISKGKILESLVTMLENSLSDKEKLNIITNRKLKDVDEIEREIDVYVETIFNKRKFTIAVECKNYNSKNPVKMIHITSIGKIELVLLLC